MNVTLSLAGILGMVGTLLLPTISLVVWLIRLEGRLNQEEKTRNTFEANVVAHFATKAELIQVSTSMQSIAQQLPEMKATMNSINGKIDAFLIKQLSH